MVDLLGTDAVDQRVQCEEIDVFEVVEGAVGLFEFFGWLAWIDSFEDAQTTEVFEGQLEFFDGFGPADILGH